MIDNEFLTLTKDNKEVVCTLVSTLKNKETGKDYIIYTDGTKTEDNQINYMASIYTPRADGGVTHLEPIETEKEWQIVEAVLEELKAGGLDA